MKINFLLLFAKRKNQQSIKWVNVYVFSFFLLIVLFSCADKTRQYPEPLEMTWNFDAGLEGWSGGFAEYPMGEEAQYALIFEHDTLPLPLDQEQHSIKLSGNNLNGDLFMFAKKKIDGLDPNSVYFVTFTVEFASNMTGDGSIADSPGNLVYLGAGAINIDPHKVNGENNSYGMNIGKCNLSQNGEHMIVLGDLANGSAQPEFVLKDLENENPFRCVTGENGELWIIIGIDSGLLGINTMYINSVKVALF